MKVYNVKVVNKIDIHEYKVKQTVILKQTESKNTKK